MGGKVLPGEKSGRTRYLNDDEEDDLVRFLINCGKIGFPRSRMEVMVIVQQVCESKGIHAVVSHGWWKGFVSATPVYHSELLQHSSARVRSSTPEQIDTYFDVLEQTLLENGLLDKPCQTINLDETGMPLDPKKLTEKGVKNPSYVSSGSKSQVTVVSCISASGYAIPPMVVWGRKTLHPDMIVGKIPGTFYRLTKMTG